MAPVSLIWWKGIAWDRQFETDVKAGKFDSLESLDLLKCKWGAMSVDNSPGPAERCYRRDACPSRSHPLESGGSLSVVFYAANGYTEQGRTNHVLSSGGSVPCMRMKKVRPAAFPNG